MEGIFAFRGGSVAFGAFGVICACVISVKFGEWGLQAIRNGDSIASIFLCLLVFVIAFLIGSFSIIFVKFNKGAFLIITDKTVEARYGWNTEFYLNYSDIMNVSMRGGFLLIRTKDKKAYHIPALINAKEINKFLKESLNLVDPEKGFNINEASETLHAGKKKFILYTAITVFFGILMFINIFITVILIGPNVDISNFNNMQSAIFISFIIIELSTIAICFIFASKTGKENSVRGEILHMITVYKAKLNKNIVSDYYGTFFEFLFYNEYLNRIIIFQTKDITSNGDKELENYSFIVEKFNPKKESWEPCYNQNPIYDTYADLKKDIDELFYNECFEE